MLPEDDITLKNAFERIISQNELPNYTSDIAELIYKNELTIHSLNNILSEYKIKDIRSINSELLDLLILYIYEVLRDDIIDDNEKKNINILKLFFKIKEGDFYKSKYKEIEDILHIQFEKLYLDNRITKEEALHNFKLRSIFDLSHSQFDKFKEKEVRRALESGAKIVNLDTSIMPKNIDREDM
jgi:hypothetical protein